MPARPRILIAEPDRFSARALAVLGAAAEVELRRVEPGGMAAALADYDVVWIRLGHRIGPAELAGAPRGRVLATPVTGLDHVDLEACAERGVRVISLRGETEFLREVRATAEHTVALALALLRRLPAATAAVARGQWDRDAFAGGELFGKTAGVVGLGRLGAIVARYLAAFDMRVLGFDPRAAAAAPAATRVASLAALLAAADLVTLHVDYGPATRHLIGAAELATLRPGAVLVNTSRGGVIDEAALLDALASGHLAGAALDVLDGEPAIGPDHPLVRWARDHDNLLITPHLGGHTRESFDKTEVFLAGKVVAALAEAR